MTWLRVDDGFGSHEKIVKLSDKQFRVWVKILCFCARYSSLDGDISTASKEVRGVTAKFLDRYRELRLIDVGDDGVMRVHDWVDYLPKRYDPTNADRQQRIRDAKEAAGSNTESNVTPRAGARALDGTGSSLVVSSSKPKPKKKVDARSVPTHVTDAMNAIWGPTTNLREGKRRQGDAEALAQSLDGTPPEHAESDLRRRQRNLYEKWQGRIDPVSPKALAEHWAESDVSPRTPPVVKTGAMTLADDIRASSQGAMRILAAKDAARNGHYPLASDIELDALEEYNG